MPSQTDTMNAMGQTIMELTQATVNLRARVIELESALAAAQKPAEPAAAPDGV